jgi:hypothetical protein
MEGELRQLKSHLLNGIPLVCIENEVIIPPESTLNQAPSSLSPPRKIRLPTMGDAGSEHLLLAGKRLSHLRRIQRVPISSAILQQAYEIVGVGKVDKMTGAQKLADFDRAVETKLKAQEMAITAAEASSSTADISSSTLITTGTPPGSPSKLKSIPPTTPRRAASTAASRRPTLPSKESHFQQRSTSTSAYVKEYPASPSTPFAGIQNLLEAAQTMIDPSSTSAIDSRDSSRRSDETMRMESNRVGLGKRKMTEGEEIIPILSTDSSPKRRKLSVTFQPSSLTTTLAPTTTTTTTTMEEGGLSPRIQAQSDWFSALDVLAEQASQTILTDSPLAGSPGAIRSRSSSRNYHVPLPSSSALMAAVAIPLPDNGFDDEQEIEDDVEEDDDEDEEEEEEDEEEDLIEEGTEEEKEEEVEVQVEEVVSRSRIGSHTRTTSSKAIKSRSTYQRWEPSEDEKLVRAIIKHGKRWDSVASDVPSRSYHQVRQRWLRGLQSGEALPDNLLQY